MENEPVVIQAILLSDHVIREAGSNKLTLIGCFSVWNALSFPFTSPKFVITIFLGNFRKGGVEVSVTLRVETPEKHVIWSAIGKIGFPKDKPAPPPELLVEIPFFAEGIAFGNPGRYTIRVIVDGDEVGQRDFYVRSVTAPSIDVKNPDQK
jgi:hypothetical protein